MYIITTCDNYGMYDIKCTETKKTAAKTLIYAVLDKYAKNDMPQYPDINDFYKKIGTNDRRIIASKFRNEFFDWINHQPDCSAEQNIISMSMLGSEHAYFSSFNLYETKDHMV